MVYPISPAQACMRFGCEAEPCAPDATPTRLDRCLGPSLERLEAAARTLGDLEAELAPKLREAMAGAVSTFAACVGPPEGVRIAGCLTALAQQTARLAALSELSTRYEQAAAEYRAALEEHVACLESAGTADASPERRRD